MKAAFVLVTGLGMTAVLATGPARLAERTAAAQPPAAAPDKIETLPPFPKDDPNSKVIENPDAKGTFIEVLPNATSKRVVFSAEVCLREGPLEVLLCKQGTKEHEAILRVDQDAREIHKLLLLAGGESGKPPQFINPKTMEPEFKPATGSKIRVLVHYKKDGKLHTHPAQEWVWNREKKKILDTEWVFAGSQLIKDPDNPDRKPYYAANGGEVISISNFPYSMLDVTAEISKDDAQLNYEVKTEKVPPLFSKVWVILEPVPAAKK